jgi:integral membrane protein
VQARDSSASADQVTPPRLRGSLLRYRVMAYTTAVLLIVLVFVGIPIQVADHRLVVVKIVGTLHGYLYIVYLFAAFDLTRRLRLRPLRMALVLLAGTVPFCAFVAERLLTRMVERSVNSGADASEVADDPSGRGQPTTGG